MKRWQKHLFELTPLGKADKEVRKYLKGSVSEKEFNRYETSLRQYRHMKLVQTFLRVLLYASLITSVATTIGLDEAELIQRVASYLGTSLIIVLYAGTSYITMIRREAYHVQREILISKAT